MGRTEDLSEAPPINPEAVTVSWETVQARTQAAELSSSLRMFRSGIEGAADMARHLRRAREQQRSRRGARPGTSRTELEGRVAALEKELAALKLRLERDVAGPVASLVEAGRITEARLLVGLLAQASPAPVLERWAQVLAPPVVQAEKQATGSPLARNAEWLRQNAEAHAGKWVALRDGTLVDEDPNRVALQRRLEQTNALEGVTFVRL